MDTQRQSVDVYRRASNTLWSLHLFGPGDRVELACLSNGFPIAALYENVDLPNEPDTPDGGLLA